MNAFALYAFVFSLYSFSYNFWTFNCILNLTFSVANCLTVSRRIQMYYNKVYNYVCIYNLLKFVY